MDKVIITKNGQNLLARMAVGEISAIFTKVCTSNAEYEVFELEGLTELSNICQETSITNVEVRNSQEIVISANIDNQTLDTGYYITIIGVYVKAVGEKEILYAVVPVSAKPYMPESTGTLSGASIRLTLKVGNSVNIEIAVDESTAVTLGEFNAFKRDIFSIPLVFEDYESVGSVIPDPEEAVSQVASGKSIFVLMRYIKASLKGILNLAQRALNIAMGRNQARVFATVEALDAWLAVPANVQQLNVGDNFYITATDVPDYWWDGTQKQKLETQKVDLTTYDQRIAANASAISELNGNISAHNHDSRYYTENEINNLLTGKSDTSHTHAWSAITGKPSAFTPADHNHDSRYYTETEINNLLVGKTRVVRTSWGPSLIIPGPQPHGLIFRDAVSVYLIWVAGAAGNLQLNYNCIYGTDDLKFGWNPVTGEVTATRSAGENSGITYIGF